MRQIFDDEMVDCEMVDCEIDKIVRASARANNLNSSHDQPSHHLTVPSQLDEATFISPI